MIRILLVGALGRMGRTVAECAEAMKDVQIAAGVDVAAEGAETTFPLYTALSEVRTEADVVIDFSRPESLADILSYCRKNNIGAVLATTGYTEEQKQEIADASTVVPVFQAPNFSIGVALVSELVQQAARVLDGRADVEIVERHHSGKVDAPSGTALALGEAVKSAVTGDPAFVFGREGRHARRGDKEIGIHAVRGGTLVGEHDVMFLCPDEEVDISHKAYSRDIFARGALAAAQFVAGQSSGMHDMHSLLRAMGLSQ